MTTPNVQCVHGVVSDFASLKQIAITTGPTNDDDDDEDGDDDDNDDDDDDEQYE